MSEFKGTPKTGSSWTINVNNPLQTIIENICIIDESWSDPLVQADAHLISAAPELLEALQGILNDCGEDYLNTPTIHSLEVATTAIAKALGKEVASEI